MKKFLWAVLLAGCATTSTTTAETSGGAGASKEEAAFGAVKQALGALPKCQPGADVGALHVKAAMCTKKFCGGDACCNSCTWKATYDAMDRSRDADPARVKELLHVGDDAMDCEIAAWGRALEGQSLAFDAPSCVVR